MIRAAASQATPYSGLTNSDIPADFQSEPTQRIPVAVTPPKGSPAGEPQDLITLSQEGRNLSRRLGRQPSAGGDNGDRTQTSRQTGKDTNTDSQTQLSAEEQQTVLKLKQRDLEVKTHEAAHLANAGQYAAGGPSYSYQTGPDGRRYAVGGEVPIDISKEKTPEETVQKMRVVRRAALAPANPSSADRSIAAAAGMAEAEAMREINNPERDSSKTESTKNISGSPPEKSPAENNPQQPITRLDAKGIYA